MRGAGGQHRLWIGALVSLLVHGATVGALAGSFRTLSAPDAAPAPTPEAMEEDERTPLGNERSTARTIDWVGYDRYREHLAPQAESEQALMELGQVVASSAGAAEAQPEAAAPAEPTPEPADATGAEPAESQDSSLALLPEQPPREEAGEVPVGPGEADESPAQRRQPALDERPETPPAPAPQESRAPSDGAAPTQTPAPQTQPNVAVTPGNADKQADATSRKKVVEYKIGEPLAAQGLDIKTVRPQFSIRTQVMAFPSSPLVRISFNRFGSPAKVELLQSTGYEDVDRPLMDAMYRWRATGEAHKALSPTDIAATVDVTLRIRLR